MREPLIAPSVLSADFADIDSALRLIEQSGADWIHLDVMDGHFVPPITFGAKMVQDIRKRTRLPLDAHLMVEAPERQVEDFAEAGADFITFHPEACVHAHRCIQMIRNRGCKPGISIVPSTPVSVIEELLPFVELILVMTVNPGYGGQDLLPFCLEKVKNSGAFVRSSRRIFLFLWMGASVPPRLPRRRRRDPTCLSWGRPFSPPPILRHWSSR
jgi:Pentose-5-phosphate-3-epimerase